MSITNIDIVLVAIILFILSFNTLIAYFMAGILLLLTIKKVKWYTLVLILIGIVRLLYPSNVVIQNHIMGNVISINPASFVVATDQGNYLVISEESFLLDDYIEVHGKILQDDLSPHFYAFDYQQYQSQQQISASLYAEEIKVIQDTNSLRGRLHEKIMQHSSSKLMMNLLLNQNLSTDEDFIIQCGFHYGVLIYGIRKIANYFFNKKKSKSIQLIFITGLFIILQGNIALFRYLFFILFEDFSLSSKNKVGLFTLLVFFYHPPLCSSLAFIIPIGLKLLPYSIKYTRVLFLITIQSFFFSSYTIFNILFFTILQRLIALITVISVFDLVLNTTLATTLYSFLAKLYTLDIIHLSEVRGKLPIFLTFLILLYLFYNPKFKYNIKLIIIVTSTLYSGFLSPFAEVSMINVGQGDSFLIRLPFNQGTILVDTGKASAYQSLKSFLFAKGIKEIDALIITHNDDDHNANVEVLMNDFNVKELINVYQPSYQLNQLSLNFLSTSDIYDNDNDNSLVFYFTLNHLTFLFTGDISKQVELDLLQAYPNLACDVLKIAHHGSKSSSSDTFIDSVHPQLALISSGYNNSYHHPSVEVLQILEKQGIYSLNTAAEGDISIYMTRFFNFIMTANQQFVIINEVIEE